MSRKKRNDKKNMNKFRAIFIIIAIAFIVINIKFYSAILKMNMLPAKYVTIITTIEILLVVAITIGIIKKHKTLKLNIICAILAIIISGGIIFANTYVDATLKFLNKLFSQFSEVEEYYVIVNNDSAYAKIDDANGKKIYTFQLEEDVKQKLKDKVNSEFVLSDSLTDLGNALLSKKIEFAVVSLSQYNILDEEIEGFKEKTKIIDTETHEISMQATIEDENSDYKVNNGKFNIYVSGIDTYGKINNVSRTDANVIITVNTNTHEILLTSIPRDYYVTLHSKQAKDKLTHSGIYGIAETVTTVEDLLDIDINYYVRVNFTTVVKLIDTLGGVDVYSDYNFGAVGGYRFQKGYNHLKGDAALAFSRERHSFNEGDNQRVKNQQHVIEAVIKKVTNGTTILSKYTSILSSMEGTFQTNFTQDEISNLVKEQLDKMPKWTIKNNALTGTGASSATYSMGSQLLYVMIPDETSVKEAKNKIDDILK